MVSAARDRVKGDGMPSLKRKGRYGQMEGWYWWLSTDPRGQRLTNEGWKLHIGGNPNTAQDILDVVAPALQRLQILHKVLPRTESFETQTGTQTGKWFCAYPCSIIDAFSAVLEIDDAIRGRFPGSGRGDLAIEVPNEIPVGDTVVYTRYGSNSYKALLGPDGTVIPDNKGVTMPSHITNPWDRFGRQLPELQATGRASFPANWQDGFPVYSAEQHELMTPHRGR